MVCVGLRDDANKSFFAGNVDALTRRIVRHIIGITYAWNSSHDFSRVSVEDYYFSRYAGPDKQAVMSFIDSHRGINSGLRNWPRCNHLPFVPINNPDLF